MDTLQVKLSAQISRHISSSLLDRCDYPAEVCEYVGKALRRFLSEESESTLLEILELLLRDREELSALLARWEISNG